MSDLYSQQLQEVQALTDHHVEELISIWSRIFPTDMCKENLQRLMEHANTFYEEVQSQSLEKEQEIKLNINELKNEAENLCRLLKTNVELPSLSEDMPLVVLQSEIDKNLEELRQILHLRRENIYELLQQQKVLCDELCEQPRQLLTDPLPSEGEIQDFTSHLENLREIRVERMNHFSFLRREIKNFFLILNVKITTELENRLINHSNIKLSRENLDVLQNIYKRRYDEVKEIRDRIDALRNKVELLWDRLNTSHKIRNAFEQHNEYTQDTYDAYYNELQRCEIIKSQNIKYFVEEIRQDIAIWWNKTLKPDMQRKNMEILKSNCFNDDLLNLHEMELQELKEYYETNKEIFELLEDRKILWDRMTALEAKSCEPGRYNNRGGQLLKEEKERKIIATKLPKIEQQITELVHQYENREQKQFLVFGESVLTLMTNQWKKKREDKELLSSARKKGQTTLLKTPFNKHQLTISRTPMSLRNISCASSIRKTPSCTNISKIPAATTTQKRKLKPSERSIPSAKRSLMYALNSPTLVAKPTPSSSRLIKMKTPLKSAMKKRVIATTIPLRKSGRLSNSSKKRRSQNKPLHSDGVKPKILINGVSDGYTDDDIDDAYDSFEKCIEPDSRSSIIQSGCRIPDLKKYKNLVYPKSISSENSRLARLPAPRIIQNPSKMSHSVGNNTPASTSTCVSRKLTTKNLPIII